MFTNECHEAFCRTIRALISTPIILPPDWSAPIILPPDWDLSFKIMCDVSNHVVGAVLEHKRGKKPVVIYYASRMLGEA